MDDPLLRGVEELAAELFVYRHKRAVLRLANPKRWMAGNWTNQHVRQGGGDCGQGDGCASWSYRFWGVDAGFFGPDFNFASDWLLHSNPPGDH
jgi:hypothetical protein